MPRELTGAGAGMSMMEMDMPDCANMKKPMPPCKDPNSLCLGAICIPVTGFLAPASTDYVARAWTISSYEGRLCQLLQGRTIAPALEPPIFVA